MSTSETMSASENNVPIAWVSCSSCDLLHRFDVSRGDPVQCERCGARVDRRKPNSIARTWAFLIAATILYIPANVYPIMTVSQFGDGEPDTIITGVMHLIEEDLWPLAVLVFFASIVIPVVKILSTGYLLWSVRARSTNRLREKAALYRCIEFIGRWSMVDIFMVSILVAIVRLGNVATVEPGPGAIAFASVVVLTMFAATAFDPRLLWDNVNQPGHG